MRCEICGAEATSVCRICGRAVCDKDRVGDLCSACYETLCELCRTNLSVGYCSVCGRLVCDSCSVKRGVELVCLNCLRASRERPRSDS